MCYTSELFCLSLCLWKCCNLVIGFAGDFHIVMARCCFVVLLLPICLWFTAVPLDPMHNVVVLVPFILYICDMFLTCYVRIHPKSYQTIQVWLHMSLTPTKCVVCVGRKLAPGCVVVNDLLLVDSVSARTHAQCCWVVSVSLIHLLIFSTYYVRIRSKSYQTIQIWLHMSM